MKVRDTALPGCLLFEPAVFEDARGHFFEVWSRKAFATRGIDPVFVQGNVSRSARGVLRGLHYQLPFSQGKLLTVQDGAVFDVAVDVRQGSATFGQWAGEVLSDANRRSFWVPPGFAHGFVVLSESATFSYLVTAPYTPAAEGFIRWDDPAIGIRWPVQDPVLNLRDASAPTLDAVPLDRLPVLAECAVC